MSLKTISIITISVLLTIVLMNNTDDIHFWLFGEMQVPKLVALGSMFFTGLIVGFLASRPLHQKKEQSNIEDDQVAIKPSLSQEDQDYLH